MFKKPLDDLKTSAPLRNSDRKKLRQRVLSEFSLGDAEDDHVHGDLLVPEGIQSVKFTAHSGELGLAYLAPDGDPLWFTLGKGSSELIPSVYTLWKRPDLLPTLSTPSAVVPVLMGGADLMAPGVITHTPALHSGQLTSIAQYEPAHRRGGVPLGVARMVVDGAIALDGVARESRKGKAAVVLHMYKDYLWEMGAKTEPPELALEEEEGSDVEEREEGAHTPPPASEDDEGEGHKPGPVPSEPNGTAEPEEKGLPTLTPEEVSALLRLSLLQALNTTLSSLPPSAFPIPSSTFYSAHLLPSRPCPLPAPYPKESATPIDIKHSTFKSLSAFLRSAEKDGLLSVKERKGADVLVSGVNTAHEAVAGHAVHRTVGEADAKRHKKLEREGREREEKEKFERGLGVVELWKAHTGGVRGLFEDTSALYTLPEIKLTLNTYITSKSLINPNNQQLINVGSDELLGGLVSGKGTGNDRPPNSMKREELLQRVVDKMQPYHRIDVKDKMGTPKKGELKPISVVVKLRQGRKACTLLTNFEPFSLSADALAEELRKLCASSTAVSPLPGKNAGLEVMVQGKQIKAVVDLLMDKGIPKKWIESEDQTEKKKK